MKNNWTTTAINYLVGTFLAFQCYTSFSAVDLTSIHSQNSIRLETETRIAGEMRDPFLPVKAVSLSAPLATVNEPEGSVLSGYQVLILQAAREHELDPALIQAVIMVESDCNPNAVSKHGARGLMQLMPGTARELGVTDSFDPAQNINGGTRYLRKLLDRFDNDVRLALAAYNAGSRYVRKYNGVPPFSATRAYVEKVIEYQSTFRQQGWGDDRPS